MGTKGLKDRFKFFFTQRITHTFTHQGADAIAQKQTNLGHGTQRELVLTKRKVYTGYQVAEGIEQGAI